MRAARRYQILSKKVKHEDVFIEIDSGDWIRVFEVNRWDARAILHTDDMDKIITIPIRPIDWQGQWVKLS